MIGVIPFTYFRNNNKPVGSSFLRVDSLLRKNPDFEKWKHGKKYNSLIFQKAYWIEMMTMFNGPKILDLCDPDWIKNSVDIVQVSKLVHAITCSSEKMASLLSSYFPDKIVVYIPDRLDLDFYPSPKELHRGKAKRVVWFGFIHNAYETLEKMVPVIKQFGLKLVIISNENYIKEDMVLSLDFEYHHFNHDTAYDIIRQCDISLNPKSSLSFFKYKSNNKSLISWVLGLPVAHSPEELIALIHSDQRNTEVSIMSEVVRTEYDINESAQQYRDIFDLIKLRYF